MWDCNLSSEDIPKGKIQKYNFSTAQDILAAWAEYNFIPQINEYENILNTTIWGNSLIRKRNKPIFDKNLVNSNIYRILDIWNPGDRRFLMYGVLFDQFGPSFYELFYCSIRAAIPNIWKIELRNNTLYEDLDMEPNWSKLGPYPTKRIYWTFIERHFHPPKALVEIWNNELKQNMSVEEFLQLYPTFITLKEVH